MIYKAYYRLLNEKKYIVRVFLNENETELKEDSEILLSEEVYNYLITNDNFKIFSYKGNLITRFYVESNKTSIEDVSDILYDLSLETVSDSEQIITDDDDTNVIDDILSVFSHRFFRFYSKSLLLLQETQNLYEKLVSKNIFICYENKEDIMEKVAEEGDTETINLVIEYITKLEERTQLLEDHQTIYDKLRIINTTRDADIIASNSKDIKNIVMKYTTPSAEEYASV